MRRFALLVFGLALLAGIAATVSGGTTCVETRWVITDLGMLRGRDSGAQAINDRGQIVGSSTTQAFLWENGKMRALQTLHGLDYSQAADINNSGLIVGSSYDFDWDEYRLGMSRAILWENGRMRPLVIPRGHISEASAVNDRGEVVGWEDETVYSSGDARAVLWQRGEMHALGVPASSQATGINEQGQVVGVSGFLDPNRVMFNSRGFSWTRGTIRSLGRLYTYNDWIYAINEKGQIAGGRHDRATVWESGKPRSLATIRGRISGARSINNAGQIVGWVGDSRAALWQGGKLILLPNLPGGTGSSAYDINERGQIVGWANPKSGKPHAVLWTLRRR
jgi:probable HAF family extracellular repeat protein